MVQHYKTIIEKYIESYNEFDVDGMLRNLAKEIVFENITGDEVNLRTEGIVEFQTQAGLSSTMFLERKQTVKSWNFDDKKVTIDVDFSGILAIDLHNGKKAGDKLELSGRSEFIFEGINIISIKDFS